MRTVSVMATFCGGRRIVTQPACPNRSAVVSGNFVPCEYCTFYDKLKLFPGTFRKSREKYPGNRADAFSILSDGERYPTKESGKTSSAGMSTAQKSASAWNKSVRRYMQIKSRRNGDVTRTPKTESIEKTERYHERTGHYPERGPADKIYRNRGNLAFCKEHHIRLSGPRPAGRRQIWAWTNLAQDFAARPSRP